MHSPAQSLVLEIEISSENHGESLTFCGRFLIGSICIWSHLPGREESQVHHAETGLHHTVQYLPRTSAQHVSKQ